MKEVVVKLIKNEKLNASTYLMEFSSNCDLGFKKYNEFIMLSVNGYFLRRPFSICDFTNNTFQILVKIQGNGTKELANSKINSNFNCLVNLGNGFDVDATKPLFIAGGIGIAPFIGMVKYYNKKGIKPTLLYGERNKDLLCLRDFFENNTNLIITTDDGSIGFKGNVIDYLKENKIDYDKYYACGPNVMMMNLEKYLSNGYHSLEARFGCGIGACMGCSIKTKSGYKRICKEGPVFLGSEIIYE